MIGGASGGIAPADDPIGVRRSRSTARGAVVHLVRRRALPLVIVYGVGLAVLYVLAAPSPPLLSGVMAGAFGALRWAPKTPFPVGLRHIGLAIIGVGAGSLLDPDVVETVTDSPVIVIAGVVGTLVVTMAAGQLLRFSPHVDGRTATYASIAGGSSGVTGIAREMGAEESIVSAVQYLRVVFVLATVPLIAPLVGSSGGSANGMGGELTWTNVGFAAGCVVVGLSAAHWLTFGASRLVIPMLLAAGVSLSGLLPSVAVPSAAMNVAYAITGLAVGFSFTRVAVRHLRQMAWLVVVQMVLGVAACAGLGVALAMMMGIPAIDGYLATTPAGLPAVTAVAVGADADLGLIMTMQILRIFIALLMASVISALITRRGAARSA